MPCSGTLPSCEAVPFMWPVHGCPLISWALFHHVCGKCAVSLSFVQLNLLHTCSVAGLIWSSGRCYTKATKTQTLFPHPQLLFFLQSKPSVSGRYFPLILCWRYSSLPACIWSFSPCASIMKFTYQLSILSIYELKVPPFLEAKCIAEFKLWILYRT